METTELCEIAHKYRTDKCPQIFHTYTPVYYEMFKDKKDSFKKVLELGIGSPETMKHTTAYQSGASLRMWRDFFPNAQIYGVDIIPETMFTEDRITTILADTTKKEELENLIKTVGSDLDVVIDDGPHATYLQINTARTLMPLLDKKVIYIIEDVKACNNIRKSLPEYDVTILRLEPVMLNGRFSRDNNLIVVKHK
jgi:hypothetical protein